MQFSISLMHDCWLHDNDDDGSDNFCYEVSPLKAKGTLYWTGRQFSTGEDGLVKEPWPDVWAD